MNMFKTLLNSIPKNRSEFVNELEIPEVTLEPYVWTEPEPPEESLSVKSEQNSIVPESTDDDRATLSTDTSLPLSRAMTDSEIDYGLFRRLRSRSFCDPWDQMKAAMDAFPPEYVAALHSFQSHEPSSPEDLVATCAKERIRRRNDVLLARMRKYFKDDCCAFSPDDPAWLALEEAVNRLELDIAKVPSQLMERDGSEASAPESAHKVDSSPCDI